MDLDKNAVLRIEIGQSFVTDVEWKAKAKVLHVEYLPDRSELMFNIIGQDKMKFLTEGLKDDPNFQRVMEIIEYRNEALLKTVVEKLDSIGWTMPTDITMYAIEKIEKEENINEFLVLYFSSNNFRFTQIVVDNILKSNIRNGLKRVVSECWLAFQSGLFSICAIALMSVIEGILSEFGDNKKEVRMMKVCQKNIEKYSISTDTVLEKYIWMSYHNFISKLYQKSDFTNDEPKEMNRHWLLHGRSNFDINEIDCLRKVSNTRIVKEKRISIV
ncbi:MAG: hypothetical protein UDG86_09170 [Lachnospiraceae bacterium]|nr:hypothetical protein [Lachnospiraceae bacterium]